MTLPDDTKAPAPWTETFPADWKVMRIDAVADVLFSNVDKLTIEGEQPVRLCLSELPGQHPSLLTNARTGIPALRHPSGV